jgi:hypothetical protein
LESIAKEALDLSAIPALILFRLTTMLG